MSLRYPRRKRHVRLPDVSRRAVRCIYRLGHATEVAKRLNLLNKQDRIMLFQAVLYGKEP